MVWVDGEDFEDSAGSAVADADLSVLHLSEDGIDGFGRTAAAFAVREYQSFIVSCLGLNVAGLDELLEHEFDAIEIGTIVCDMLEFLLNIFHGCLTDRTEGGNS